MGANQKVMKGLSRENINLIVVIFLISLVLWGPIEPYGIFIRMTYLILLPFSLHKGLHYFGKKWEMGELMNERLARGISGMLAGAFFIGAGAYFMKEFHSECDQTIQTRDGEECIGEYIEVSGPDIFGGMVLSMLGIFAGWYSVAKHDEKTAD